MKSYTTNRYMQRGFKFQFMMKLIVLFLFTLHFGHANAQYGDESFKGLSKRKWPAVIHKLTDIGLPESMVKRIRRYTKKDMDSALLGGEDFHESFAEKDKNDVFEDYVVKVMLRFVGGNIVGFVKKEPLMQSNQGIYEQCQIDIPIEWCALDSLKQLHCAKTPEEIRDLDSIAKPQDWHQKLDANEVAQNKVEDNIDLLQMLETKSGRKKLKSKKMLDSLISISSNMTGDDSLLAVQKITRLQKELQIEARKKKGAAALDDSTIAAITNGLTGLDSINAIKSYVAMEKAQKDKRYIKAEKTLDSTTIASLTQGLSPTDSVKAVRKYLMGAMATKRSKQTRGVADKSNGALPMNANDSTGLSNPEPAFAAKQTKSDKKKKKGDDLDEATIAKVTAGLTGIDSLNAIKEYKLAAKMSGKDKKKKKGQPAEQVTLADANGASTPTNGANGVPTDPAISGSTSGAVTTPVDASAAVVPAATTKLEKADKKKKKGSEELDEATIASITKGLTGDDSVAAIRDYKLEAKRGKDSKKKKGNKVTEQVVTETPAAPATNTPVENAVAITPPPNATKDSSTTVNQTAMQEPPTNGGRIRVVDSAALRENAIKDSIAKAVAQPVVSEKAKEPVVTPTPVENKPVVADTAKAIVAPVETPKVEEKPKEPVVTPPPAENKPVVADTAKAIVAPVETPKATEKSKEPVVTPTPVENKPVVADTAKAIVAPVEVTKATEKPKEPVVTPTPVENKPMVADTAKAIVAPMETPKATEKPKEPVVAPPPVENKPVVADTTSQSVVSPAAKDSTTVAPPVVPPIENKPTRQKVEAIVPVTTDSTANKQKLATDSISKPATDTIGGNKIVVPSDTTKPR